MKRILSTLILCLLLVGQGFAKEKHFTLYSPNGKLVTHIVSTADGELTYDMVFRGVTLMLPSHIGLNRQYGKSVTADMSPTRTRTRSIDETIPSPFTRQASMRNHCNELSLQLKNGLAVDFRAYDDGIAYRFRTAEACTVRYEKVEYNFAGDYQATVPYVINYSEDDFAVQFTSSFENLYETHPLSQLDPRRISFLPLLVHAPGGVKVCLTETHLEHFPGLYLQAARRPDSPADVRLEGVHAPLPKTLQQGGHNNLQLLVTEREEYIARLAAGSSLPWRIAVVTATDAQLAVSNLSYLLAAPCRVDDLSWIRPGKVAWDWWNNWNIEGVDFPSGINNDTYKHYIDFASRYGIEYVILDEGWAVSGQADLFQVVPEIDLPMLCDYAKQKNVGLILWAGYWAFNRDMEGVCKHYSAMGIKGWKIDFMDRDDDQMVRFYEKAAATAAKYHMLVDFHGAYKPTGLQRTYPNIMNFEGIHGLEQMKWSGPEVDQVTYDVTIPFTRLVAGPADYTQGAMRNATRSNYYPCNSEPMSQGTRCHQLAEYIVFDAPLTMLCDSPTNYRKEEECTAFIASVPTVWDETIALQGKIAEYVVVARRSGNKWYVGALGNWDERDLVVDLSRLGVGAKQGEVFADGVNADRKAQDYRHEQVTVNGTWKVHLAPGGGAVLVL